MNIRDTDGKWSAEKIVNHFDIVSGATPDTDSEEYWGGEINWISPKEIDSKYITETERTLTEEGLDSCSAKILPVGSVLMTSRAGIGNCAINKIPLCTNQGFKSFVPKDEGEVLPEFLMYWLIHNQPEIERFASGSTFTEVNKSTVSRFYIPVPPLEEQERIVSLLSDVDEYIEKTSERVHSLEQQKQAVLQQVFAVKGSDINTINPQYRWESQPIGEVCSVTSGNSFPQDYQDEATQGIPVIKVGDLKEELYIDSAEFSVTQNEIDELGHTVYDKGTIILPKNGESIRTAKVNILNSECAVDNNVMVISVESDSVTSEWVAYFLDYYDLIRIAPGTTAPTISNKTMNALEIPVPSKSEKDNIISTLSQIDEALGQTNKDLESMRELKKGLLQDIFSG